MPVVVVTAAALADAAAEQRALAELAGAVAAGLHLRPEDVYVTLRHSAASVLGTEPVRPWPVIALHGGPRPAADLAAAAEAAEAAAAAAWRCPTDEVWVQWFVREKIVR